VSDSIRALPSDEEPPAFDRARIERAVQEILEAIGEDPSRDGLRFTPRRIAEMYEEIFGGLREDPRCHVTTTFEADHDEMVMVRDIPLYSVCVPSKQNVNTFSGAKKAAEIEVGDVLWSFDDEGSLVTTTVQSVGSRSARELIEVVAGAQKMRVTPEHPVLTPGGWVAAGRLTVGDKVRAKEPRTLCQERYPVTEGYDLGYVLGAVGSDASVQERRRISLVVRDLRFAQRFAQALEVAFDIPAFVESIEVPTGFLKRLIPMYRVRIVSSYIGELMLHWFGGSKATKQFHFPRVVLRSREMMQGFLDGYCDGDGYTLRGVEDARVIISSNDGFLDELAAVLGNKPGGRSPSGSRQLYVSRNWHKEGWYGRPGFRREDVRLLPPDAEWVPIDRVERVEARGTKPYRVYSFECSPHPTFLVGGIQTHNCEHHLVPFHGRAHVAYIPDEDGRIAGLSKVARMVDGFAKRPQVQERLTTQIADALVDILTPHVFVVIEAEHLCMSMRGIKKPGSLTVTSAVRGMFKENPATRAEAMSFIGHTGVRT
jgi:GTP cyclohydrolase I